MNQLSVSPHAFVLRQALALQEQTVAADIALARMLGSPYHEETVTERLLLGLAAHRGIASAIRTVAYSKPLEARTGADWLWAFRGLRGGIEGLLVQAKILTAPPQRTYAVGQRAAKAVRDSVGKSSLKQRDVLLRHAQTMGLPAAYAFYNDEDAAAQYTLPCPWSAFIGPLGGVALAGASAVDCLARALSSDGHHVEAAVLACCSRPLSCALLCHHDHTVTAFEDLDQQVHSAITSSASSYGVDADYELGNQARAVLADLFGMVPDDSPAFDELLGALDVAGVVLISEHRREL